MNKIAIVIVRSYTFEPIFSTFLANILGGGFF
jgi:hypothetical protein